VNVDFNFFLIYSQSVWITQYERIVKWYSCNNKELESALINK